MNVIRKLKEISKNPNKDWGSELFSIHLFYRNNAKMVRSTYEFYRVHEELRNLYNKFKLDGKYGTSNLKWLEDVIKYHIFFCPIEDIIETYNSTNLKNYNNFMEEKAQDFNLSFKSRQDKDCSYSDKMCQLFFLEENIIDKLRITEKYLTRLMQHCLFDHDNLVKIYYRILGCIEYLNKRRHYLDSEEIYKTIGSTIIKINNNDFRLDYLDSRMIVLLTLLTTEKRDEVWEALQNRNKTSELLVIDLGECGKFEFSTQGVTNFDLTKTILNCYVYDLPNFNEHLTKFLLNHLTYVMRLYETYTYMINLSKSDYIEVKNRVRKNLEIFRIDNEYGDVLLRIFCRDISLSNSDDDFSIFYLTGEHKLNESMLLSILIEEAVLVSGQKKHLNLISE